MKKLLFSCLIAIAGIPFVQGQNFGCGVDATAGAVIKQRLMDNRNALSKQQIYDITTNRVVSYIPLSIHNVSNTSNEGRTEEDVILGFLCGLNTLYADQDIQFFIHNQIIELTSDHLDANSSTPSARAIMLQNKVSGTLNIYIGRSTFYPNGSYLSFYDPNRDVVFLQQPMLSSAATTEAHEIGHYLSLPHTFYGWEGVDAEAMYSGQSVPASVNGETTELVTRGAGANCATAADGFCDTEADFHSTASVQSCNFTPSALDNSGATLDPNESNIMSYYSDNCQNSFSQGQKNAIAADVALRSWTTLSAPNSTVVTGISTATAPADGGQGNIAGATVRLDWSDVTGADWYLLEVYGTTIPPLYVPNTNDKKYKGIIVSGNSHYDLPTAGLTVGARYAWRVKALNQYSTCAGVSSYYKFEAVSFTGIDHLPLDKQMMLKVNNNPISASDIPLTIHAAEAVLGSIRIYGMDGKEMISLTKQSLNAGENLVQIPASDMPNGMYLAVVSTKNGSLQQKFVIQR